MDSRAVNMSAVITASSFYVGGNWGFLLEDNPEFVEILDILNNSNVKKIRVSNGYIVFCDYDYLQKVVSRVENVTPEILNRGINRLRTEVPEFQKFLTTILRKNCKYLEDCGSYYKIRINGIEYPAFSLTLSEALKEVVKLNSRMSIYICEASGFEKLNTALSMNSLEPIYSGVEISNSCTGAFLTLRIEK